MDSVTSAYIISQPNAWLSIENYLSLLLHWKSNLEAILSETAPFTPENQLEIAKEIIGEKFLNSTKVGSALNEYFTSLTQKYTEQIKINVELLNNISLSSIDMVTYNKFGPYKLTVPFFPVITDTYKFNYGQPISMDIYE